ncbi:MAG: hypothetical protein Q9M37_02460 [Desulfonauticus sp.]|nr:hypothetical protein [Desulfonauticus sp.]
MNKNNSLRIVIGIILEKDNDNAVLCQYGEKGLEDLQRLLQREFQELNWEFVVIRRKDFPSGNDVLELLEYGADLKLEYNLDFSLVLTELPLKSSFHQSVQAVPSAVLETAVISVSGLEDSFPESERNRFCFLNQLILYCLGKLWGLSNSVILEKERKNLEKLSLTWSEEEKKDALAYLLKIADPRLEETGLGSKLGSFFFYLQVILREFPRILRDILVFRFWQMFLRLGKIMVTTAISIVFLFLSAEAWELGAALQTPWLNFALVIIILFSSLSLYFGQNLHRVASSHKLKEQAVRSKCVLFGSVLISMLGFWLGLFVLSLGVIYVLPAKVLLNWAGLRDSLPCVHFAKIMATFGVAASALGGNLEETDDLKTVLFYSDEV